MEVCRAAPWEFLTCAGKSQTRDFPTVVDTTSSSASVSPPPSTVMRTCSFPPTAGWQLVRVI
ncbi:MAG: hypothetical protein VX621_03355, partial [Candidatus Thermoplasmatota archaeon]|nr:hypothetical protein [Candidatus Thermoplasmatota archaeon]